MYEVRQTKRLDKANFLPILLGEFLPMPRDVIAKRFQRLFDLGDFQFCSGFNSHRAQKIFPVGEVNIEIEVRFPKVVGGDGLQ